MYSPALIQFETDFGLYELAFFRWCHWGPDIENYSFNCHFKYNVLYSKVCSDDDDFSSKRYILIRNTSNN